VIPLLSQTTEYALRAMSCLAYSVDELVSTADLAEVTHVPMNYLAKVLQLLAKADLITGRRGVGGGYKLNRPAQEISMMDVINAIDPIERIGSCPLKLANHSGKLCPLHSRLDEAAKSLINQFGGVSLYDMLSEDETTRPLCDPEMAVKVGITFGQSNQSS
jgi:Rrf2 family transcriptional regulator, nitric oxide-sensitive transcriptional repressor